MNHSLTNRQRCIQRQLNLTTTDVDVSLGYEIRLLSSEFRFNCRIEGQQYIYCITRILSLLGQTETKSN